jgi:formylglycine-generating enzyme required for sulfatase activity
MANALHIAWRDGREEPYDNMERQSRRRFLAGTAAAGLTALSSRSITAAVMSQIDARRPVFEAPDDPAEWPAFREALRAWRQVARQDLDYDDALYRKDEFAWAATNFSCCFAMMCDLAFYDACKDEYTVEAFLNQGRREFGGYDSVVLWHAYPRIGLDQRNQFDFYRDMPGGVLGVRNLCRRLHVNGVKAFVNCNPWDTGTRREGRSDVDALCSLVQTIEADGIFLDTLRGAGGELRKALDAARPGVVLESELELPLHDVPTHHLSWAQWFPGFGVLRNKWFERRHMQHQIRRWDRDHSDELHMAWLNGSGMLVWENVFGSWMGWNRRDRSMLRTMLPIQRRFARLLVGEKWTPLVTTEQPRLYGSLWEGDHLRLWALVNRSDKPIEGPLLRVPFRKRERYVDLIAGRDVQPTLDGPNTLIQGTIATRHVACFVAGPTSSFGKGFERFINGELQQQGDTEPRTRPLTRPIRIRPVAPIRRVVEVGPTEDMRPESRVPDNMVLVPSGDVELTIRYRTRECGLYESGILSGLHRIQSLTRRVSLRRYAIDVTPVTNIEYERFLNQSGYRPKHQENFLSHWDHGKPPKDKMGHPVVLVDLNDARAYAEWARKRLPTEEEWQFAAQGHDGRPYPWGDTMEPDRCNDMAGNGTTPVKAFPAGRSPFGCYDMCGNVWEWTESEYSDGRTRFAMLRGGSYFRAEGSPWYFDGGPQQCDFTAKMLLMWPGLDRCATIGFRCVVDIE